MIETGPRPGRRTLFFASAALLAITLLLGGAGADYPLTELAVEAAAIVLLAMMAWRSDVRFSGSLVAAAALLAIAVPLLQLLPLPPGLWSSLPGRERTVELLGLIGEPLGWRPLTLDPEATWRSLLAMMPGLALLLAVLNLAARDRARLALLVVAFGIVGSLVGALQVAGGPRFAIVQSAHAGLGTGLFSNRNHQAAFLVAAILLCGALGAAGKAGRPAISRPLAGAAILLMAAGVVATTSRAGALMVGVAVPVALLSLLGVQLRWRTALAAAAMLVAVALAGLQSSAGALVRERFAGAAADGRLLFWQDVPAAISAYWPAGSGIGTFPTVFQAVERLDFVTAAFVNNAHNDYLELAVEGGLIALLAILAGIATLALAVVRGRFEDRRARLIARAAALAVLLLLLHSAVDYPLRMLAVAGLFGLLCGLLVPPAENQRPVEKPRLWLRGGMVTAAAALLIAKALVIHLAAAEGDGLAPRLAPHSPTAATLLAIEALKRGDSQALERAALQALRQAPVRPEPVALLAVARQALGEGEQTASLMAIAGAAGWRESITNLWLLNQGLATGNPAMAAQRGDALLRQRLFRDEVLAAFASLAADPAGVRAIAERLAADPPWRRALLVESDSLEPSAQLALLRALRRQGMALSDEEAAVPTARLLATGQAAQARAAWTELTAAGGPLGDGGFDRLAKRGEQPAPAPFEWRLVPLLGARVYADSAQGPGLHIEAEAGSAGTIAEQTLVLAPGAYRLSAQVRPPSPGLRFVLSCAGAGELPLAGEAEPGAPPVELAFRVPRSCRVQVLGIRLTGRSERDVRAVVRAIRLLPRSAP